MSKITSYTRRTEITKVPLSSEEVESSIMDRAVRDAGLGPIDLLLRKEGSKATLVYSNDGSVIVTIERVID